MLDSGRKGALPHSSQYTAVANSPIFAPLSARPARGNARAQSGSCHCQRDASSPGARRAVEAQASPPAYEDSVRTQIGCA